MVATRRPSPAVRLLWRVVGRRLFALTFHDWYGVRCHLLRFFGARVARSARIRPSVRISHPWNLSVGSQAAVGDRAVSLCPSPVRIGKRSTVSPHAMLCASAAEFGPEAPDASGGGGRAGRPADIAIGDDAWVAADVFVGPGVAVGTGTVVGARSTVRTGLPPWSVCAGDSARVLGERRVR